MRWWKRPAVLQSDPDALDDAVGDAIVNLHECLKRSEASGAQWRPQSRLARTALRAIAWR